MNLLSILLQAQPGLGSMLPMILVFGAFFIYMIWSQKKQEKKIQQYRANLKVGDSVILQSGIYGKIKSLEADGVTIRIEIAPNVVISVNVNYVYPTNDVTTK
ncbi:MAG: preprotein translocase subunit YajC [Bacteroidales bacterium]|nr:preprotein translocase subunit YajC [Candidatus Scybalocola fimicaballi]